jgi:hypothetical protein
MFRRDQSDAKDVASFKHVMRYNDWRHDPLSAGAPFAAICGRGDLAPEGADFGPVLKGCYDSKVISPGHDALGKPPGWLFLVVCAMGRSLPRV